MSILKWFGLERTLEIISSKIPPPAGPRVLQALPLGTSRSCQGLPTLPGKDFFQPSNQNLPPFSLKPFPPVLSLPKRAGQEGYCYSQGLRSSRKGGEFLDIPRELRELLRASLQISKPRSLQAVLVPPWNWLSVNPKSPQNLWKSLIPHSGCRGSQNPRPRGA